MYTAPGTCNCYAPPPLTFTTASTAPASLSADELPPPTISRVIREQSEGDSRLAAYYRKRVAELRKEGKAEEEIPGILAKWETTESDD